MYNEPIEKSRPCVSVKTHSTDLLVDPHSLLHIKGRIRRRRWSPFAAGVEARGEGREVIEEH